MEGECGQLLPQFCRDKSFLNWGQANPHTLQVSLKYSSTCLGPWGIFLATTEKRQHVSHGAWRERLNGSETVALRADEGAGVWLLTSRLTGLSGSWSRVGTEEGQEASFAWRHSGGTAKAAVDVGASRYSSKGTGGSHEA